MTTKVTVENPAHAQHDVHVVARDVVKEADRLKHITITLLVNLKPGDKPAEVYATDTREICVREVKRGVAA